MDWWVWLIVGIVAVLAFFLIVVFNTLVVLRNRIDNAMAQIDVQTKKRYDLIPNLVESVKGYAKHEKAVFTEITKARAAVAKGGSLRDKAKAQNMLTDALKSLFAVAENYPRLRASENFMMLQEELSGIEGKIAYARQFYNDSVLTYNNRIQTFPTNTIAGMLGYKTREYYEVEAASRKAIRVSF